MRNRLLAIGNDEAKRKSQALGEVTLNTLWQDIHFAVRVLLKNWSVTAIIVVVLALGIGANTAIFSSSTRRFSDPCLMPTRTDL